MNTALTDQLDAAAREARGLVAHAAAADDQTPEWVHPPNWLTAHIGRLQLSLLTGATRPCPHVTLSPHVVWSAAWRPAEVWCARCALTAFAAVRGTAEDHMCDGCRRYTDPIYSVITAAGPLMVAAGLCAPCRGAVQVAEPPAAPAPRSSKRKARR